MRRACSGKGIRSRMDVPRVWVGSGGSLPRRPHVRHVLHPSRWPVPGVFHQRDSPLFCALATIPWRVRLRRCAVHSALPDRFPTRSSRAELVNREIRRGPAPASLWSLESRCRLEGGTLSLAAHQLLLRSPDRPVVSSFPTLAVPCLEMVPPFARRGTHKGRKQPSSLLSSLGPLTSFGFFLLLKSVPTSVFYP